MLLFMVDELRFNAFKQIHFDIWNRYTHYQDKSELRPHTSAFLWKPMSLSSKLPPILYELPLHFPWLYLNFTTLSVGLQLIFVMQVILASRTFAIDLLFWNCGMIHTQKVTWRSEVYFNNDHYDAVICCCSLFYHPIKYHK